ncbi:MAG: 4-hydroxythreonine-4-phosphate dehydrogenase PdxA [Myxococcota bacterium]|nr:4-hydroxythreonine-4-phosphate dehydrogenase PdxA [Myxococcota bacterium]
MPRRAPVLARSPEEIAAERPLVGISLGDPSGIGPEVLNKALKDPRVRAALVPVVFGDASFKALGLRRMDVALRQRPEAACVVPISQLAERDRQPGRPSLRGGRAQLDYVEAVIIAAKTGRVDAICTAPVSKEQITRAGVPFVGHTELLAEAFDAEVLMLMDGPRLKVALATNHLPISRLSKAITVPLLLRRLRLLNSGLTPTLGRPPRLAVCGLNPHAGEGGTIGLEEQQVILPAIQKARQLGLDVEGPFAADGLFAKAGRLPYDAVLAMFHDQGLVATKVLDFDATVNVTLGLPVPRTSPDHGVAYDLAGKGKANPEPMIAALLKAAAMARALR